jgi:NAD(P)-dependent dehydrogenase (short-subunit alcohol dehydrogenase family)
LAAQGASKIVIADINSDAAAQMVAYLPAGVGVQAQRCDVSQEADVANLISQTEKNVGPIDLFVANAGILVIGTADISKELWDKVMGVNVM